MNDFDILKFLKGFGYRETKEEILDKYLKGTIDKDEFLKRMKEADRRK